MVSASSSSSTATSSRSGVAQSRAAREDVELHILKGRIEFLDTQRSLAAVRCQKFATMMEKSLAPQPQESDTDSDSDRDGGADVWGDLNKPRVSPRGCRRQSMDASSSSSSSRQNNVRSRDRRASCDLSREAVLDTHRYTRSSPHASSRSSTRRSSFQYSREAAQYYGEAPPAPKAHTQAFVYNRELTSDAPVVHRQCSDVVKASEVPCQQAARCYGSAHTSERMPCGSDTEGAETSDASDVDDFLHGSSGARRNNARTNAASYHLASAVQSQSRRTMGIIGSFVMSKKAQTSC